MNYRKRLTYHTFGTKYAVGSFPGMSSLSFPSEPARLSKRAILKLLASIQVLEYAYYATKTGMRCRDVR